MKAQEESWGRVKRPALSSLYVGNLANFLLE